MCACRAARLLALGPFTEPTFTLSPPHKPLTSTDSPSLPIPSFQVTSSQGILSALESDQAVATKDLLPLMSLLENSPVLCAYGLSRCDQGVDGCHP